MDSSNATELEFMDTSDDATELEFLKWFYVNCDFGPAHSDIIDLYKQQFKQETGKELPEGYKN